MEMNNLEMSKNAYQLMNAKITEAISALTNAKNYVDSSCTTLKKYYQSNTATKKVSEFEREYMNIDHIIKELQSEILVASNNKINSINSSISNIEAEIISLEQELNSIDI